MDHSLLIHAFTEGQLGCFQVWAIKETAAKSACPGFCVDVSFQFLWVKRSLQWECWIGGEGHVRFCRKTPNHLPTWLQHFAFPPATNANPRCFTSSWVFGVLRFGHAPKCLGVPTAVLICNSLTTQNCDHLFIRLLATHVTALVQCLFRSSAHFLIRLLALLLLGFKGSLCIPDDNP